VTLHSKHPTLYPLLCAVFVLLVGAGTALTAAWLQPGYVECRGFLESENWMPVYSPGDGIVRHGRLEDGRAVKEGEILIVLDDRWVAQNLKNIRQELSTRELEAEYLKRNLELFQNHRKIEES
jgi:multidrug efflux pump subunit AcrA (membrane-fusion protein)